MCVLPGRPLDVNVWEVLLSINTHHIISCLPLLVDVLRILCWNFSPKGSRLWCGTSFLREIWMFSENDPFGATKNNTNIIMTFLVASTFCVGCVKLYLGGKMTVSPLHIITHHHFYLTSGWFNLSHALLFLL